MKDKLPIIAFAHHPWDEPQWMNRQHILTRLGERGWPVVYNTGAPSIWQRKTINWKNISLLNRFVSTDNIYIHLGGKLFPRWPKFQNIENLAIKNYCNSIKSYMGLKSANFITLIFHPAFATYAKYLNSKFLALHVYDNYSGMHNWDKILLSQLIYLVDNAALITASTESMAQSLPGNGPKKARIIHNGVDPAFFIAGHLPCPDDLAKIPYPRIANLGTINLKMDMKTIAKIATEKPTWQWIFVGRLEEEELKQDSESREGLMKCKKLKNVHFLGEKSRFEIPAYAQNVDVNTICYRIRADDWVISGYPLKLNEYLAVGKPVVASPQTAICNYFSSVVDIASNFQEWKIALERALTTGGVSTPEERKSVAMENTWEKRVDLMEQWLFEMIE